MICEKCGSQMPEDAYFCGVCSAPIREKHSEKLYHPTAHGGVFSEVFFFDKEHLPCVKEAAWFMEIREYDEAGKEIYKFTAHRKQKKEDA
ncbi:MAG: hypothetical protein IJI67_02095 [Clostridia bacterium]|nr:hypothetical protein [Clostridia bacterium]